MTSPDPADTDLPPEVDLAIQRVLAAQPGFSIPTDVHHRITAALAAEAATRATLSGNDAELTEPAESLVKSPESAREHEGLS